MEPLKDILKGQKRVTGDLFAVIDLILLSLAYFVGVGACYLFLKKSTDRVNKESHWQDSALTKKEAASYLKQY